MRENERERLYYLFQERKCPMHFLDNKEILDTVDYLLKNGVVVPPCKVGQTVYCLIQGFKTAMKATVYRITMEKGGIVISCSVSGYFGQSYMATDFGKTVFLTQEDAEAKLKGGAE